MNNRSCAGVGFGLIVGVLLCFAGGALAKEECTTVKECAQQMVIVANELKEENKALLVRVTLLEKALAKQAELNAAALEKRFERAKNGSNLNLFPGGNTDSGECTPGSFMVGVRRQTDGGGPHGITSWLFPVCRTMP